VLYDILKALRTLVLPTKVIRTRFLLDILILIGLVTSKTGSLLPAYYLNTLVAQFLSYRSFN